MNAREKERFHRNTGSSNMETLDRTIEELDVKVRLISVAERALELHQVTRHALKQSTSRETDRTSPR